MSVASKNPFALLEDGDDASRPSSPAPQSKTAQAPAAAAAPAKKQQSNRGGPASRGGKYYARGGARSGEAGNLNTEGIQEPLDGGRRPEGRGRGRGGRGGGGRGRGGGGGGRFDKHSQTGKTDSDKKVHQGWGGDEASSELKAEEAATTDAAAETNEWSTGADASGWDAPATTTDTPAATPAAEGGEKTDRPRREREPEEEDNTLTLEQYLAQQKEKEAGAVPQLETTRQVDADWKDVKPLEKGSDDSYFVGKTKSAPKAKDQKVAKESIEVGFAPPPREGGRGRGRGRGGDRSDRGDRGSRGGRGRGGARGGRQNGSQTFVRMDDETAFPSLT